MLADATAAAAAVAAEAAALATTAAAAAAASVTAARDAVAPLPSREDAASPPSSPCSPATPASTASSPTSPELRPVPAAEDVVGEVDALAPGGALSSPVGVAPSSPAVLPVTAGGGVEHFTTEVNAGR